MKTPWIGAELSQAAAEFSNNMNNYLNLEQFIFELIEQFEHDRSTVQHQGVTTRGVCQAEIRLQLAILRKFAAGWPVGRLQPTLLAPSFAPMP